jgi:hypothetical protein
MNALLRLPADLACSRGRHGQANAAQDAVRLRSAQNSADARL